MYIKAGAGAYSNDGRNSLATRPIDNFDMSFAKTFPMNESRKLEFRGDLSNIFNHAQYTPGYINSIRERYVQSGETYLIPDSRTSASGPGIQQSASQCSVRAAVSLSFDLLLSRPS